MILYVLTGLFVVLRFILSGFVRRALNGDAVGDIPVSQQDLDHQKRLHKTLTTIIGDKHGDEDEDWKSGAERLKKILKAGWLDVRNVTEDVHTVFLAHRAMADCHEGALGIRFTVQFNLFAGSVMALGNDEQRKQLVDIHRRGELGCFALTERAAGVISGLKVDTTATWLPDEQMFDIHSPNRGAQKVWISQGMTAKWAVIVADLIVDDVHHGAHAFLAEMDNPSVIATDMGRKTTFNALDNADIEFRHLKVPLSTLLSRYATITDNKYDSYGKKPPSFITVAQRLLSGRLCIADAGLIYTQSILKRTVEYAKSRDIFVGATETVPLSELPIVRRSFDLYAAQIWTHRVYVDQVQQQFAKFQETGREPPAALVDRIAAAKFEAVDRAINLVTKLRSDVGAFSLMDESPFGKMLDIFYCAQFAEGDSRILKQKMARDLLKPIQKSPATLLVKIGSVLVNRALSMFQLATLESQLQAKCDEHLVRLAIEMMMSSKANRIKTWTASENVYPLAEARGNVLISQTVTAAKGKTQQLRLYLESVLER